MKRRELILASTCALVTPAAAGALRVTPAQTRGPYYPDRLPAEADNDLLHVAGQPRRARGTVLHLDGRVVDVHGTPVAAGVVEIWQCDSDGRYHHPRDRRGIAVDAAFQGYGRDRIAGDGSYRFLTLRPVPYPGRTPHIHFAVTVPGRPVLVTQMYVRGDPRNGRDFLYAAMTAEQREAVTVALRPAAPGSGELAATFDIVLGS